MKKEQFIEITNWQKQTFGNATAKSKLLHLKEEIEELLVEIDKNDEKNIRNEFADCFILLFGAAAAHGYDYQNICNIIETKFEIVKKRVWDKPDKNGVVRHVDGFIVDDNTVLWFGMHKGIKMANVPESWLLWYYNNHDELKLNDKTKALIKYIENNMDLINKGALINRR